MQHIRILCAAVLVLMGAVQASAQSRFLLGGQVASVSTGEFDTRDTGLGLLVGARVLGPVWGEAVLLRYPGEFPENRPFSQHRVEGLFGASVGPDLGSVRPFVKASAGFVRYGDAGGPVACILIFPPPLSCQLAGGRTLAAYDVGVGISAQPVPMTFLRVDLSRRSVRYPGPSFGTSAVHDGDFWDGDVRFAVSAGLRF